MSGPVQRQPWFWAILTAVAALFIFSIVIVAANRGDDRPDSTTVVQPPSPAEPREVVPVPVPAPPVATGPSTPSTPAAPTPPGVRERTIIIPDRAEAKPAAPPRPTDSARVPERPAPRPAPPESAPETSAPDRAEIKEFRSTGLPGEIRFDERPWKAFEERVITDPARELKSIGMTEEDAEVWVPAAAVEPYDQIFLAVLDEEGKYVVYRKP